MKALHIQSFLDMHLTFSSCLTTSRRHLRQCCLRLGQPEGHLHVIVHLDGRGQRGVGLERAHAECLSQGEGLMVVSGGLLNVWGLAMHSNLTEEPPGMRLVAAPS